MSIYFECLTFCNNNKYCCYLKFFFIILEYTIEFCRNFFLSPRLRRKRIFWGWTWTGSLPLIEDNGRFSRIFIVFSWCITSDIGHQRLPSLKNVSLDTQRSKGLLVLCPDTLRSHKHKISLITLHWNVQIKKILQCTK